MEYPKLEWRPLINKTEDELTRCLQQHGNDAIVFLRCRYSGETKWEYLTECCCPCYPNNRDIMWFNDWYEGQQEVEYLAVYYI